MKGDFAEGLDDMFLSLYAPACAVKPFGAEIVARLVKPYYNRQWTGTHAIYYTPPQEETDLPFITVRGKCIWCSGDIFSGYANRGPLHLRDIVRNMVNRLNGKPLFKMGKLPACARVIVNEQPNHLNVSIVAYSPERHADTMVVEDPIAVVNGSFEVLTAGRNIKEVVLVPAMTSVEFRNNGDYTEVNLSVFEGYALIVLK